LEEAMSDLTAPSNWYLDLQVPSILRRRDGHAHPTPLQVPELVPKPSDPRAQTPSASSNRAKAGALKGRFSGLRSAATTATAAPAPTAAASTGTAGATTDQYGVAVHGDLAHLEHQVAGLRRERDDLLAAAIPLRKEVAELRSDKEELAELRSEIEILRRRKHSLEDAVAGRPRAPEQKGAGPSGYQRFHDS
jgi:hypothetical protein